MKGDSDRSITQEVFAIRMVKRIRRTISQTQGPGKPFRDVTTRRIAISAKMNSLEPSLSVCREKSRCDNIYTLNTRSGNSPIRGTLSQNFVRPFNFCGIKSCHLLDSIWRYP